MMRNRFNDFDDDLSHANISNAFINVNIDVLLDFRFETNEMKV